MAAAGQLHDSSLRESGTQRFASRGRAGCRIADRAARRRRRAARVAVPAEAIELAAGRARVGAVRCRPPSVAPTPQRARRSPSRPRLRPRHAVDHPGAAGRRTRADHAPDHPAGKARRDQTAARHDPGEPSRSSPFVGFEFGSAVAVRKPPRPSAPANRPGSPRRSPVGAGVGGYEVEVTQLANSAQRTLHLHRARPAKTRSRSTAANTR